MTDAFKKLVENAPVRKSGLFNGFMFSSNGIYDGFFGKNGYDNMVVLGQAVEDDLWYRIACEVDIFNIAFIKPYTSVSIDIPSEFGVPRLFFHKPIQIDYDGFTSAILSFDN